MTKESRVALMRLFSCALLTGSVLSSQAGCIGDGTPDAPGSGLADVPVGTTSAAIKLGGSVSAFETVAASRGEVALDVTVLGSETGTTGVVTTARAGFIEIVEPLSDGYEQSWRFDQPLGTDGALTIAVDVSALEHVSTTDKGRLLRRPGEFEVRYSHGIWIDASGTQWPVPARYDHGRIQLTIPIAVLSNSSYPAVLDPQIVVTPG